LKTKPLNLNLFSPREKRFVGDKFFSSGLLWKTKDKGITSNYFFYLIRSSSTCSVAKGAGRGL